MKKNCKNSRKSYVMPQTEVMKIEYIGSPLMASGDDPNANSGNDQGISGTVDNGNNGGSI